MDGGKISDKTIVLGISDGKFSGKIQFKAQATSALNGIGIGFSSGTITELYPHSFPATIPKPKKYIAFGKEVKLEPNAGVGGNVHFGKTQCDTTEISYQLSEIKGDVYISLISVKNQEPWKATAGKTKTIVEPPQPQSTGPVQGAVREALLTRIDQFETKMNGKLSALKPSEVLNLVRCMIEQEA